MTEAGSWEQAARRALTEGHKPGEAAQALMRAFLEAIEKRESQPRYELPVETLESRAEQIVAEFRADRNSWPEAKRKELSAEMRNEVRRQLAEKPQEVTA